MKTLLITLGLIFSTFAQSALAVELQTNSNIYSDTQSANLSTKLAVSVLTKKGIITGNPDGTFRPDTNLNRAEFVTIAMRLSGKKLVDPTRCFPDVPLNVWYNQAVCTAKDLGFIRGNVVEGVPANDWLFAPQRPVSYVEALKILYMVYGIELNESQSDPWYRVFINQSLNDETRLPTFVPPAAFITRAEMAQLVLRFIAWHDDQLDELDTFSSSSSSQSSSSSVSTSQSSVSVSSSSSSSSSTSSVSSQSSSSQVSEPVAISQIRSNFIVLGSVSVPMAGMQVFSEPQPLIVDDVLVELVAPAPSVSAFRVYDSNNIFLGTATRTSPTQFSAPVQIDDYTIPQAKETSFYVRAITNDILSGGVSGEQIQVSRLGVRGTGFYDNSEQTKYSTGTYQIFETAASEITSITNGGRLEDILIAGNGVRLGAFTFIGTEGSVGNTELAFTDLFIALNTTAGVTVSNVELRDNVNGGMSNCSVSNGTISCTDINLSLGSFEDAPRTVTLYGDVTVATNDEYLQLSLNEPGSPSNPGSVYWTDGYSQHTWVYGDTPLANSTQFKR